MLQYKPLVMKAIQFDYVVPTSRKSDINESAGLCKRFPANAFINIHISKYELDYKDIKLLTRNTATISKICLKTLVSNQKIIKFTGPVCSFFRHVGV